MAPRVFPTAAPRGAPAAKVANATDLILDGGNAWARIPSWVKDMGHGVTGDMMIRTNAGRNCCSSTTTLDPSQDVDCNFISLGGGG